MWLDFTGNCLGIVLILTDSRNLGEWPQTSVRNVSQGKQDCKDSSKSQTTQPLLPGEQQAAYKLCIRNTSLSSWTLWSLLSWLLSETWKSSPGPTKGSTRSCCWLSPPGTTPFPIWAEWAHKRALSGSKLHSVLLPAICLQLPHTYFMISGTFLTSSDILQCIPRCLYYFYVWLRTFLSKECVLGLYFISAKSELHLELGKDPIHGASCFNFWSQKTQGTQN